MAEEDYRNRLVGDIRGVIRGYVEGERPLYREIAEDIFDVITERLTRPKILDQKATVDMITEDIEKIFGSDLTGRQHEFNRSNEEQIRKYYEKLVADLVGVLVEGFFPILNEKDSGTLWNMITNHILRVLVRRRYLKSMLREKQVTYVLPNGSTGTIVVNEKTTPREIYHELKRRVGQHFIIFYNGRYLQPWRNYSIFNDIRSEIPLVITFPNFDTLTLPELLKFANDFGIMACPGAEDRQALISRLKQKLDY